MLSSTVLDFAQNPCRSTESDADNDARTLPAAAVSWEVHPRGRAIHRLQHTGLNWMQVARMRANLADLSTSPAHDGKSRPGLYAGIPLVPSKQAGHFD